MPSRRTFLEKSTYLSLAVGLPRGLAVPHHFESGRGGECGEQRSSLAGLWLFRLDPEDSGKAKGWHLPEASAEGWTQVQVPHTWQTRAEWAEYMGVAWYRRVFDALEGWANKVVRVEFEAVFHSATVWVNGEPAGEHRRKGYTTFVLDVTRLLRFGQTNGIAVRVDNSFDENMLPRGRSSDWAHDGGICRPVQMIVTPRVFIERVDVDAVPELATDRASLDVTVVVQNRSERDWQGKIAFRAVEDASGRMVLSGRAATAVKVPRRTGQSVPLPRATFENPKLWHFDHPHLYRLVVELDEKEGTLHTATTIFGVRSFEVKDGGFYLNGERVWLMGVERMAGSHPEFGMAEPTGWLVHDHDDLKSLNCVFTRVHWPQDKRVFAYCDRHGILIQVEVPAWGPRTFEGMQGEPSREIMENGLEQLREMIQRDRNHPSIFAWGLCNEVNGQNPPAYRFVERMYEEAKKLDPRRPCTYASNSLQKTPERDVAGRMDFISWNEYYETWYKGTVENLGRNIEEIHRAFPNKPLVVSEYGYCACTADRPEGDGRRIEILREHNEVFRSFPFISGLIFFSYNDYRTHIGDKGVGAAKQRVHGVVDLYGTRKPSYEELRRESSPVAALEVRGQGDALNVTVESRKVIPAYTLSGYRLRVVAYGFGDIPLEQHDVPLPRLEPGQRVQVPVQLQEKAPMRVQVDVLRPTGFSALTRVWRP